MHQFIYTANMYFVWTVRFELYEADIVNNWWFVACQIYIGMKEDQNHFIFCDGFQTAIHSDDSI